MNSQFLQYLKIFMYKNHKTALLLYIIEDNLKPLLFILAVNFSMFVVQGDKFSSTPLIIVLLIMLIPMIGQYRVRKNIYDTIRQVAIQHANENRDKLEDMDIEDYIKWSTMESFNLYESRHKEEFQEEYSMIINMMDINYLVVLLIITVIVIRHFVSG